MLIIQVVIPILNVLKYIYIFVLYVNRFVVRDNYLGDAFEWDLS